MKLELKHLAAYLPYKINPLKIKWFDGIYTLDGLTGAWNVDLRQAMMVHRNTHVETVVPILRPMDELLHPPHILSFGYRGLTRNKADGKNLEGFTLNQYDYLFRNHFDVFGLIDAGLAIDINTISS